MTDQATRTLGALLYEDFELLDLFGPLEMFGNMQGAVTVRTVADRPGLVRSAQGPRVHADHGLEDCPPLDLLLVPGGIGTRTQVENARLVDWLRARSGELEVAMTVCTGSALLAAAGVAAGIDMALAVVSRLAGQQTADFLATATEYDWHRDADWDPFARVHGLV